MANSTSVGRSYLPEFYSEIREEFKDYICSVEIDTYIYMEEKNFV